MISEKIKKEYRKYKEFLFNKGLDKSVVSINNFNSAWHDYSEERKKNPSASHTSIRKQIEYDSMYGTKYKTALGRKREIENLFNDPDLRNYYTEEQYEQLQKNKEKILGKGLRFFKTQTKEQYDEFIEESGIYSHALYEHILNVYNKDKKVTKDWFSRNIFGSP